MPQKTNSQSNLVKQLFRSRPININKFVIIPLVILGVLFLPSISLAGQTPTAGYGIFHTEGGAVPPPDEAEIILLPEGIEELVWVKLYPEPKESFLGGAVGSRSFAAAELIPTPVRVRPPPGDHLCRICQNFAALTNPGNYLALVHSRFTPNVRIIKRQDLLTPAVQIFNFVSKLPTLELCRNLLCEHLA